MQTQQVVGISVLALILAISTQYFFIGEWEMFVFLLFGLGFGIVLQRSRFCFASAFRDLFITRDARLMRGVIVGLLVATAGFSIIMFYGIQAPKQQPVGFHTLIGGILFGLGMVIAGGCASGTLFRAGEGYVSLWAALGGALFGMMLLATTWPFLWDNYIGNQSKIWLPDELGWSAAVLVTVLVLVGCLLIATWWEGRKGGGVSGGMSSSPKKSYVAQSSFSKINPFAMPWPVYVGGILLGLLNILEYMFKKPWGITTAESKWAGGILTILTVPAKNWDYFTKYKLAKFLDGPWLDSGTLINVGIIIGAFVAASLALEFRIRVGPKKRLLQGFIGGMLIGYGARLAMGCNIGNFFSGIPLLALNGWVFGFGLLVGGYFGAKLVVRL